MLKKRNKGDSSSDLETLRKRAEEKLIETKKLPEVLAASEMSQLIHELQIHQIELQMQNEELRKAQEEIERSRQAYKSLWEFSSVAYLLIDQAGRITAVNHAAKRLFAKPEDAILNKKLMLLVAPEDRAAVQLLLERAADTRTGMKREIRIPRSDDSILICQMDCQVIAREPGWQIIQMVLTDLTKYKEIEEDLLEKGERLKLALEAGRMGMWDRNLHTHEVIWSPFLYKLLGRDPEGPPITRETFFRYIHGEDLPRILAHVDKWLQSGETYFYDEFRVIREDGQICWFNSFGLLHKDTAGRPLRVIGINQDITDRKRAEEEIIRLNATLEKRILERTAQAQLRANQLQRLALQLSSAEDRERQRIASLLHDNLQQNLASLKLNLQTVLPEELIDDEIGERLLNLEQVIQKSIDETRNLSQQISPPTLKWLGLTAGLRWLSRDMKEKHGLEVALRTSPEMDPNSLTLASILFRTVRELLFNVVKHSGVNTAIVEGWGNDDEIMIRVSDSGKGCDFTNVTEDQGLSTGFGLFTIRETIDFLGGQMQMESVPGDGCRVKLIVPKNIGHIWNESKVEIEGRLLPNVTDQKPSEQSLASHEKHKTRILVADDHAMMRDGLVNLLETQEDFEVVGQAADGREAVRLATELDPDVILLDVSMPVKDGIEAASEISQILPHPRIIAISMHDDDENRQRMLDAGAKDFLSKMVSSEELINTVRQVRAAPD